MLLSTWHMFKHAGRNGSVLPPVEEAAGHVALLLRLCIPSICPVLSLLGRGGWWKARGGCVCGEPNCHVGALLVHQLEFKAFACSGSTFPPLTGELAATEACFLRSTSQRTTCRRQSTSLPDVISASTWRGKWGEFGGRLASSLQGRSLHRVASFCFCVARLLLLASAFCIFPSPVSAAALQFPWQVGQEEGSSCWGCLQGPAEDSSTLGASESENFPLIAPNTNPHRPANFCFGRRNYHSRPRA